MKKHALIHGIFIVIMVASALISAYTLYSQSIRLDESQSIWVATKPLITILKLTAQDVQVPLYPVLLHFWIQVFGTSITIARTLSFLFFLATLPILFLVSRESANSRVAFVTTTLFALSPFVMWYSAEARTYTIFTFATCLSHLFFLRLLRSSGKTGKTGYTLATIVGIFSHYFFSFLVLTQIVVVLFIYIRGIIQNSKSTHFIQKLFSYQPIPFTFFSIYCVVAIAFLPWFTYFVSLGAGANDQPLIPAPTSYNLFQTFITFVFGFQSQTLQAALIALWPLVILLLFFIFTQKRTVHARPIEYFFLATFFPIILVFVASFVRPIFLSRYLILTTPSLFFLLAWLLLNYSKKISTYLLSALITVMFGLLVLQNISTQTPVREDYKNVSTYLSKYATPNDIIAISPPFTIYPIEYTYHGHTRLDTLPLWDRYGQGAIPTFSQAVLHEQINNYKKQYRKLYLVFSYDQGYQKDIQTYMDMNYKLIDKKKFSQGLDVRVYQLRYD